ncbi:MAG: hypothetical protein P0S96_03835 [Simkaniaceae bacterium]|nr:hypothetical protein [Candidatus Sacchlamyda saccharinae]
MTTIAHKLNAAAASVGAGFQAAGNSIKNGASKVAHGVERTLTVLGDAKEQRQVAAKIDQGVDKAYTAISTTVDSANTTMQTKGEGALAAPIKGLSQMNIAHVPVKGTSAQKGRATVRNGLASYHNFVAKGGEAYSRGMGRSAHAATNALLEVVRLPMKLIGLEKAGRLVQNALALAVGFAVRGITLAATQLAHALPYALGVAALGAAAVGIYFGGTALVGAVGITFAVLGTLYAIDKLITGGVILNLNKKVKQLAAQTGATAPVSTGNPVVNAAKAAAHTAAAPVRLVARHPKKSAALAATTAAGAAAYFYGVPPAVSETLAKVGAHLASFLPKAPVAENIASKVVGYATTQNIGGSVCRPLSELNFDQCELTHMLAQ